MTTTDILNYYSRSATNTFDILDYYFEPTSSELFNNFIQLLKNKDIKLSEHLFSI